MRDPLTRLDTCVTLSSCCFADIQLGSQVCMNAVQAQLVPQGWTSPHLYRASAWHAVLLFVYSGEIMRMHNLMQATPVPHTWASPHLCRASRWLAVQACNAHVLLPSSLLRFHQPGSPLHAHYETARHLGIQCPAVTGLCNPQNAPDPRNDLVGRWVGGLVQIYDSIPANEPSCAQCKPETR